MRVKTAAHAGTSQLRMLPTQLTKHAPGLGPVKQSCRDLERQASSNKQQATSFKRQAAQRMSRKPQAPSSKRQASSRKQQALQFVVPRKVSRR